MSQPALPFSRPSISEPAIAEVVAVLRSGWITSGPKVQQFEREFAQAMGAAHAVAVSSGTAGLDLAVQALDLQPGDEVIVPSINWVSGPNVIELHGGTTVFCEVLPETLQADPASVERLLTPRTRAIMPVHFAGMPCDLAALRSLVAGRGITIIEDAAHAAGASVGGIPVGSGEGPVVFSFHPTKNITTAEGGMVTCASEELAARLRLGRFHGIRKDAWRHFGRSGRDRYEVIEPARKYNLTDLQAALGIHQLRELPQANAARAALAEDYRRQLAQHPVVELLAPAAPADRHAWHIFVVLVRIDRIAGGRDAVVARLESLGISTALHFPAVHTQHYYRQRYPSVRLPVSEELGERLLSLPLFPGMQPADVTRVVTALDLIAREMTR